MPPAASTAVTVAAAAIVSFLGSLMSVSVVVGLPGLIGLDRRAACEASGGIWTVAGER
jgi:hypothetical protein